MNWLKKLFGFGKKEQKKEEVKSEKSNWANRRIVYKDELPEQKYTTGIDPYKVDEVGSTNVMNDMLNPLNPLSPLSPINPINTDYSTPDYSTVSNTSFDTGSSTSSDYSSSSDISTGSSGSDFGSFDSGSV